MSLRKFLFDSANRAFRTLGYELRDTRAPRSHFTMNEALRRIAARGCDVRTVIDIGASDGAWSRVAMRHFNDAQYLLFEPLKEREAELKAFCQAHSNAGFVNAAAGDHEGEVSFMVASDLDGSGISEVGAGATRSVPLTTIDAEVKRRALGGPYLIKLDTHGFELPILAGATECLRHASLLVIEVYNFKIAGPALRFHELCAHVETLGFRCADLADPLLRKRDGALWQMDLFFLPKDSAVFANDGYC
jgi:FkbM family methyltransferase